MRAICQLAAVLISLLLAPAPASALEIISGLDESRVESWTDLQPNFLEFEDADWVRFVTVHATDPLPLALGAPEDDSGPVEGQLTRVSERR